MKKNTCKAMNKFLILFLVIISNTIFSLPARSQECKITFRVFAPENTPENDTIFITGNLPRLKEWDPGKAGLKKTDNGYFEIILSFNKGDHIEYKITRGSWQNEAVSKEGHVPPNHKLKIEKDDIIEIHVENWRDFRHSVKGGITGTVVYHKSFKATKLNNSRGVAVILPKGYKNNTGKRYPVLYMHDGQNCFNPATSYTEIDWQVDEAADSLIEQGKIEEIIIVTAENTKDRMQEYNDTGSGMNYLDFLINDLKPFIDKTYRTLPDRENTAVMGSSMGGLISFLSVCYFPEIFGKAGCLSITTRFLRYSQIDNFIKNGRPLKFDTKIYVDSGSELNSPVNKRQFNKLKSDILKSGIKKNNVLFKIYHGHDHSEKSWAKRIHVPLLFLFGKK